MTDEPPFTKGEFDTAMTVIETVRDELTTDIETEQMNDAHYLLQVVGERFEDVWDVEDEEAVTTPLTLREMVRATEAAKYFDMGFDLREMMWTENGGLELEWERPMMTDGGEKPPAESATPDDVPDECEIPECTHDIENFPDAFVPPEEFVAHTDDSGRMVMCDRHAVSARLLAYTHSGPPYVDVGLYKEVAYYARALAAVTFNIHPDEKVTAPQDADATE